MEEKDPALRVVDRRWWARGEETRDETPAALKPTYVEELERQVAEQARQMQALVADHRRALEEFEQARIRIRRDVAREVERGKRAIIAELLEVLDNLDRAIGSAAGGTLDGPASALLQGVALVRDQFLARLEGLGVVRVPSVGQPFDAARHEAVTTTPTADPVQHGIVVAVLREGYAIGDEVLRPAAVVVGMHATPADEPPAS
jgi:molecular chaperone GrpE